MSRANSLGSIGNQTCNVVQVAVPAASSTGGGAVVTTKPKPWGMYLLCGLLGGAIIAAGIIIPIMVLNDDSDEMASGE